MKVCSKCKIEKPGSEFSKCAAKKDGLHPHCKPCVVNYRVENRDLLREKRAEHYAANKDYYAAYRSARLERYASFSAVYRAANQEKIVTKNRNRRAMKSKAEGRHAAADIRAIFSAQSGLCANCQTKLFKSGKQKYHVDHIMPLALGGSNWPTNLQCLCPSCNLSKGAKHPDDWAKQQGRLL